MKKFNFTLKFVLLLIFTFITIQSAKAQNAYGLSDIVYDDITKKVTTYSGTYLDYAARLHYDPAVCGTVYQVTADIGGKCYTGFNSSYDLPNQRVFGSLVPLRTTFPSPPDTRFDVISDHFVVAYFYTTVIILDDGPTGNSPRIVEQWYDPLSLNKQGGQNLGSYTYNGKTDNTESQYWSYRYFYLGSTGKGLIANRSTCEGAAAGESCTAPLKVRITNEFTGTQDLSGSEKNALLQGTVELNAEAVGGNSSAITYSWLRDNIPIDTCANQARCSTFFDTQKPYQVKLIVTQSQQPTITKTLTINGALPTFREDLTGPYRVVGGYSAIQRLPRVTLGNGDCSYSSPIQRIMLGCTLVNPVDHPTADVPKANKDIAGFYVKAIVVPPSNLISKGSESKIEFYQIIKPEATRIGTASNGNEFTEYLRFSTNPGGWRNDFQGGTVPTRNYKYFSDFGGANTSNEAITLDYTDTPSDQLFNQTPDGAPLKEYRINQAFKTFVTYYHPKTYTRPNDFDFRKALRVIDWNWNAKAKKNAGKWELNGTYSPAKVTELFSQPAVAEVEGTGNISNGRYWERSPVVTSAVTITTKRDAAVWRKTNGVWYVVNPDGSMQSATQWGVDIDIPVPGDYDGDGRADFAVYRPDNPATTEDECQNGCTWYVRKSSDGNLQIYTFGSKGDKPVPADYDGDGRADFAVYRPDTNIWHTMKSSDNSYYAVQFGQSGDVPVPSDYDGDGFDDQAVWSPTAATWKILNSKNQLITTQAWGQPTDKPVIGDYDGDGRTDIANWQSNGNWHILLSSNSQTLNVNFGLPTNDTPVPGDYDGDGKTDIAVFRPHSSQTAEWFILNSSNNQLQIQYWGIAGDIPVPAAYSRQ